MIAHCKRFTIRNKYKRMGKSLSLLLTFLLLGYWVEFDIIRLYMGFPSMLDLIRRIFLPNFSYATVVMGALLETLEMAFFASVIGIFLSIPLALVSAQNLWKGTGPINAIFSILRTLPSLIWASLLVSVFGLGKFSGILALTITSTLIGQRLLRETIESLTSNQIDAFWSIGASKISIFKYGIFPNINRSVLSVFFLTLETNVRNASVLGLVGAGGVGQLLWRDLNHMRYDNIATLMLCLFFVMIGIDGLSHFFRFKLGDDHPVLFASPAGHRRWLLFRMIFSMLVLSLLSYLILETLKISPDRLLLGISQSKQMLTRLFKPDLSYVLKAATGLLESLSIALFATAFGAFFSLICSYFAAYTCSPFKSLSLLMKGFSNLLRTFPPIITAIILFRGVGPGALSGALALGIYTTGVLIKLYAEVIEHIPENLKNSLIVTGASPLSIYRHAILPHTKSTFWSLVLFRLESNIRASTILGLIGAGGVGTLISSNISWRNWERVGTLLLTTMLLILCIDALCRFLKKRL